MKISIVFEKAFVSKGIDVLAILVTLMFYITGYCIFSPVHGYLLGNIFDKVPWYFTCLVPRVP